MSEQLPQKVRIVEVGPRDGLQNEKKPVPLETRSRLIAGLVDAGCKHIEAGAFVSPKWVPQMAGTLELFKSLPEIDGVHYSALVPNERGYKSAKEAGVREIAVFAAASETFSRKNINCTIAESLKRFEPVLEAAEKDGVTVRGYVSTAVVCPYEGDIEPEAVARVASDLMQMGCHEISLGDTIGAGTPHSIKRMLEAVAAKLPVERLAAHFHDTYGMAIANIYAALQMGVSVVDSSLSGLGGCPYAPGAAGNVATEDVVFLLNGLGVEHGIDLKKLANHGIWINQELGRSVSCRTGAALAATAT